MKILTREHAGSKYDIPDPAATIELPEKATGDVACDAARQSVQKHCSGVDGTMMPDAKQAKQGHDYNA